MIFPLWNWTRDSRLTTDRQTDRQADRERERERGEREREREKREREREEKRKEKNFPGKGCCESMPASEINLYPQLFFSDSTKNVASGK